MQQQVVGKLEENYNEIHCSAIYLCTYIYLHHDTTIYSVHDAG